MNTGLKIKPERPIECAMPSMSKEEYIIYLERLLQIAEDKVKNFEMTKPKFKQPSNINWTFKPWLEKPGCYCDKCGPIIYRGGAVFSCTDKRCDLSKQIFS